MTPESPFAPDLPPEFILETLGVAEALRRLDDGRGAREPFLLVTGDPGTGKTALVNLAIARWASRVTAAHLTLPLASGLELLEEILRRLGAASPDGANRPKLVAAFESALGEIAARGQIATIVVDDAHHLGPELLEELRLLAGAARQAHRPIEVLLIGLPELATRLEDPSLAPIRQRISVRIKLEPLSPGETRRYIRHRLAAAGEDGSKLFPRKTCLEIAEHSHGVPREINAVAAEALRVARASRHPTVEPDHVRAAVATLTGALPKGEVEDVADEPKESAAPAPATAARVSTTAARVSTTAARVEVAAKPVAPMSAVPPMAPVAKAVAAPPAPSPPQAPVAKAVAAPPAASPPMAPAPKAVAAPPAASPPQAPVAASPPAPSEPTEFVDGCSKPVPAPPAHYTPSEWVARFVGDKGPLQLSSFAPARELRVPDAAAANESTPSDAESAPPRRREPAGAAPRAPRRRRDLRVPITAALLGVVVISVLGMVIHAIRIAHGRAARSSDSTATASVTPSDEKSKASHAPAAAPASRAAEGPGGEATSAIPKGPYGLEVASHLDLQAALAERDRLQSLTGIEGWVAPVAGQHDDQYRVVLGKFTAYSRARGAAQMLMRSRTLPRVTVVSLPPKRERQ